MELHNKQATMALVRIPSWTDPGEIKSYVNGEAMRPARGGRYLVVDDLRKDQPSGWNFPIRKQQTRTRSMAEATGSPFAAARFLTPNRGVISVPARFLSINAATTERNARPHEKCDASPPITSCRSSSSISLEDGQEPKIFRPILL